MKKWTRSAYRIRDGFDLSVRYYAFDTHDECGRWATLQVGLLFWGVEIEHYLGPTKDPLPLNDDALTWLPIIGGMTIEELKAFQNEIEAALKKAAQVRLE